MAKPDRTDIHDALQGIVTCAIPANSTADGLSTLVGLVRDALGADAVALVDDDEPAERRVLASVGSGPPEGWGGGDRDGAEATSAEALRRRVPGVPTPTWLIVAGVDTPVAGDRALLLDAAAARAGSALEVARLRGDLDRAMAQILETDERLLGRIGLDIHDGPTQHLSVALLEVQLLEADLADAGANGVELPEGLLGSMERIYETLGGALTEMRELIGHLRPAQFEDRRLSDIMRDAITGFEGRTGTEVQSSFEGEFPLNGVSVTQRITFYRILQEALNNAHRHGQARDIRVEAVDAPDETILRVADDGLGFDAEQALRPRVGAPIARFGLHGMRDRAQMLGGSFSITSTPGEGTRLEVVLPRWLPEGDDAAGG